MHELNFGFNWNNKLECKVFSTLRLTNRLNVGDLVTIKLKNELHSVGRVVVKESFLFNQINDAIAYLDTGYDADECRKILQRMYKNKNVDWFTQMINFYLIKKEG